MDAQSAVHAALRRAAADHGRLIFADPVRLRAVLLDLLGADVAGHQAEVEALVTAAGCGVGRALADGAHPDDPTVAGRLAAAGLPPETARWAAWSIVGALPNRSAAGPVGTAGGAPTGGTTGAATRMSQGQGQGQDGGYASGSGRPNGSPPPRRRTGMVVGTVVAVLAAAGLGVGVTLMAGGSEPETQATQPPSTVLQITTPAPRTTTVAATTATIRQTTTTTRVTTVPRTVKGAAVVTVSSSVESDRDPAMKAKVCDPMLVVVNDVRTTSDAWAQGEPTAALAQRTQQQMGEQVVRIGALVGAAPPSATAVPLIAFRVRDALVALRTATAKGGTSAYDGADWNSAIGAYLIERDGLVEACDAASGGGVFSTDAIRQAAMCKAVLTSLRSAATAVSAWQLDPSAAKGKVVRTRMTAFDEAVEKARWQHRVLYTQPLRRSLITATGWSYNLGARGAAGQPPPTDWITEWNEARTSVESQCS